MKMRKNELEYGIDEEVLSVLCVNLCGGGYTESQTREAMIMQEDLLDGKIVIDKEGNEYEVLEK